MQYRQFGSSDLQLSGVCYGTMRYAPKDGSFDDVARAGKRALEAAIDRGINCIHSSYEYRTRWLTGRVLRDHPGRSGLHHIIKVNAPDFGEERFDRSEFRRQVEEALRDLHADRIAVVQHLQRGAYDKGIGYSEESEPIRLAEFDRTVSELAAVSEELRREGKIGHVVSFPYTMGYARKIPGSSAFDGIAAFFNPLETEMMELFPALRETGKGFIAIRPLLAGLLTDRRHDPDSLPPDDRLAGPEWKRLYDQLTELKGKLQHPVESWTSFSLRFTLSDPAVTTMVVGINSEEQLDSILSALEGSPEPPEVLQAAHEVNREFRRRFGVKGLPSGIPVY